MHSGSENREKALTLALDKGEVKQSLLGLVVALVEIVSDMLKHQAVRRAQAGSLDSGEIERLGVALKQIELTIADIKRDFRIEESVSTVREGLDNALNKIIRGV